MKRYVFVLYSIAISIICHAQLTRKQAEAIVLNQSIIRNNPYCYVFSYIGSSSTVPTIFGGSITIPSNAYCYVLDKEPLQGWLESFDYIFVDKTTGRVTWKYSQAKPKSFTLWQKFYGKDPIIQNEPLFDFSSHRRPVRLPSIVKPSNGTNYAVIISGGANSQDNHIRYWNDCSAMYKALVSQYGYAKQNIYLLISDGSSLNIDRNRDTQNNPTLPPDLDSSPLDLDGDGQNETIRPAVKNEINTVFNELSAKITANDNLFVFTTDHGNKTGSLNLWNWELLSPSELAQQIDKVKARYISILLLQCFSGAFIEPLSARNRVISTASSANEYSWGIPGINGYEIYFREWLAAMLGEYPNRYQVNADANNDGYVTMKEAFQYAKSHDSSGETPQYKSQCSVLGDYLTLSGIYCPTTDVRNLTVSNNKTVSGCNVEVSNVVVQNSSKLTVNAFEVMINGPFEVCAGSSFEIP